MHGIRRVVPLTAAALLLFVAAAGAGYLLRDDGNEDSSGPSAVILDQLSLSQPNPAFSEEAAARLEAAGYEVDYVSGEEVTVELFRRLPSYDYDIVLLRTHAGRRVQDGELTEYAHLFTGEAYTPSRHIDEQRDGHLRVVAYDEGAIARGETFFGITETFISDSMEGAFGGTTVVLMGCDVLRATALADAFIERGASTVIGWDDQVSAPHTDAATLALLDRMIEGAPAADAARDIAAAVGPDPYYGAELVSYEAK
jgi:hypothetical protein